MKKAIIAVVVLLVLALAAILIVPSFIDWNNYKPQLVAMTEDATGRDLSVDGDLGVRIFPSPAISLRDVRLSNIAGGTADAMITLKALEVEVALWPLLRRSIQVRTIRLIEPVVELEILADGSPNWVFTPVGDSSDSGEVAVEEESGGAPDISLEIFEIEDGTIVFRNAQSGLEERIENLTAELSATALATGPYAAKGSALTRGLMIEFDLAVGDLAAPGAIPLSAEFGLIDAGLRASFRGSISAPSPDASLEGTFELSGSDLRRAAAQLAVLTGQEAPLQIPGAQKISIRAVVQGNLTDLALNELEVAIGETRGTGAIVAQIATPMVVDATFAFGRVDIDAWLKAMARPAANDDAEAEDGDGVADVRDPRLPLPDLPENMNISLNVTIDALSYRGGVVRQAELFARLTDGTLEISRLGGLLPGATNIVAVGQLGPVEGTPQFDGTVEVTSDDLRGFLTWLDVDPAEIPGDRLRNLKLQSSVRVTPDLAQIFGFELELDSTHLSGGAAYAFRARPSFSLDFDLDRLNADAYLSSGAEPENEVIATNTVVVDIEVGSTKFAIPILSDFDANLNLAIGSLTTNGMILNGVTLDGTLLGGEFTLREARVDDFSGATVQMSGTASGFDDNVEITANIQLDAKDVGGLLRQTGVTLPGPVAAWNPVAVTGRVSGNIEGIDVDLKTTFARMQAAISGGIEVRAGLSRVDLAFEINNPSLYGMVAALGGEMKAALGGSDGAVSATGTIRGDLENLALDLAATAADVELTVAGSVENGDGPPQFNFAINASHPDLPLLLASVGIDYQPAVTNFGQFSLKADLTGTPSQLKFAALEGLAGPIGYAGNASIDLDGTRPMIKANLNASEILVDLLMPRKNSDAAPVTSGSGRSSGNGGSAGGERWSREQIDLSVLRVFDADLNITSRAITFGAYRFVEPKLVMNLSNGILDIEPLTGSIFDGGVALKMRVESGEAVRITLHAGLENADIERALLESAGIDALSGLFNLEARITTAGRSQYDMIMALDGTVGFEARDGVIRGIDMRSLSDRLGNLDNAGDFLSLIQTTMGGGSTRYQSFTGTFDIEDGLAGTENLSALLDGATGSGRGVVDLPNWRLDLITSARLSDHPNAPPVGLDLVGSLDAPQRMVRTQELEQYIAAQVGQTILRQLLPKSGDDDDDGKISPRSIIRGILRGRN